MKKYRWTVLLLALVLAAGVCAGCGKKQTDAPAQDNQIRMRPRRTIRFRRTPTRSRP